MTARRVIRAAAAASALAVSAGVMAWNAGVLWLEHRGAGHTVSEGADALVSSDWRRAAAQARVHARALMIEGEIPGLAVAVSRHGRIVWSEAMGAADLEHARSARRSTRFRIQSLSKTLTASALLRLADQGRIGLETPIQAYVPSFPATSPPVTPLQLASHRSGVRNYRDDEEAIASRHCERAGDAVPEFQDDSLVFRPDTSSQYSNYGYQLLGAALERAAGTSFPELMRQEVFEPLGMQDTQELRADQVDARDSVGYDFVTPYSRDGRRVRSPRLDFTCKWPSGGFLSTADDMARFAAALTSRYGRRFLDPQSIALAFRPRTPPGSPVGIALGWIVGRDWRLRRVAFNFGAGSGGRAFLALYPDDDVAIALLANLGHARLDMPRLIGVVAPFLNPVRSPAPEGAALLTIAGWVWFVRRQRRGSTAARDSA